MQIKEIARYVLVLILVTNLSCNNTSSVSKSDLDLSSPAPSPTALIESVAKRPARSFDVARHIGNAEVGNECVWLKIQNPDLKPGETVRIVFTEIQPQQKVVSAKVIENVECTDLQKTPWADLSGNRPSEPLNRYQLKITDEGSYERGYGIAVVNFDERIDTNDGFAVADLNHDGTHEYFRECTSTEGMHMTVWSGKPIKGERIWHVYYQFPYETEPTCTKRDYE